MPIVKLRERNLKLIEYSKKDLNNNLLIERYSKWLKNKIVTEHLVKTDYRKKILKEFLYKMILSKNDLFFKIIFNKKHIGNLRIGNINFNKKTCGFGIMIGDQNFHNKKIATRSLKLIMKYIFKDLKLRLIKFDCYIENIYAMKLYEKLNFKKQKHQNNKLVFFKMTSANYFKNY